MNQDTFMGGMQQQFDATKTSVEQFRAALNCRIRKNVIEPSYKHIKLESPAGVKQAIFSLDDKLILLVAGSAYNLSSSGFLRVGSTGLSTTADEIYHENVPQPTNFLVGPNKEYRSVVSTTPLVAVMQDGINQPALLSSSLGMRPAKRYEEWSYSDPEYVPVGTLMAFSGSKLYIASADKLRQYQSVSGRPLDFMLLFNNTTGEPQGNADSTAMAVATAPLTAMVPAQSGGFIAGTLYKMHAAIPNDAVLVYQEPYHRPAELFPVGVVEQNAFAQVKGETVFGSPAGLMLFNQVAQNKLESNLSPFGAPVTALLKLPLTRLVCTTVDDYVFFACETKYGHGILVFDIQTGVFAGLDLTQGAVKEFAVLKQAGVTRLFYITTGDEVYEIPLFSGEKATASVYFGEWVPVDRDGKQTPGVLHRFSAIKLGLTNVKSSGHVTVRPFCDRVAGECQVLTVTGTQTELLEEDGDFPFGGEFPSTVVPVNFAAEPNGYALGVIIDLAVDARLAAIKVETTTLAPDYPKPVEVLEPLNYVVLPNLNPTRYTADFARVSDVYWMESTSSAPGVVSSGSQVYGLPARTHVARNFSANSSLIRVGANLAVYDTKAVYDKMATSLDGAFVLGINSATETYGAIFQTFRDAGKPVYAVANDVVQANTARAQDFFGHSGQPRYYLIETRDVDYYCLSFPLSSGSPAELAATGEYATWVKGMISERRSLSPRRINVLMVTISPADNATFRAWPFARMGLHAVIAAGTTYRNTDANGILELDLGTGELAVQSTPRHLRLAYTDSAGKRDNETIIV